MQLRYFAVPPGKVAGKGDRGSEPAIERREEPAGLFALPPPVERALSARAASAPLAQSGETAATAPDGAQDPGSTPDPRAILDSIGQVVYDWDLQFDRITWGPKVELVFGFQNIDALDRSRLCRMPVPRQRKFALRGDRALDRRG